jgi:hypothetical protein
MVFFSDSACLSDQRRVIVTAPTFPPPVLIGKAKLFKITSFEFLLAAFLLC